MCSTKFVNVESNVGTPNLFSCVDNRSRLASIWQTRREDEEKLPTHNLFFPFSFSFPYCLVDDVLFGYVLLDQIVPNLSVVESGGGQLVGSSRGDEPEGVGLFLGDVHH
jgi:hypothetical protein